MGASANSIGFPAVDRNRCYAPPPGENLKNVHMFGETSVAEINWNIC